MAISKMVNGAMSGATVWSCYLCTGQTWSQLKSHSSVLFPLIDKWR